MDVSTNECRVCIESDENSLGGEFQSLLSILSEISTGVCEGIRLRATGQDIAKCFYEKIRDVLNGDMYARRFTLRQHSVRAQRPVKTINALDTLDALAKASGSIENVVESSRESIESSFREYQDLHVAFVEPSILSPTLEMVSMR